MNNFERILEFEVNQQRIIKKRDCDFSHIVAGTEGYLKAKFYFHQGEWDGCKKAASFWIGEEEHARLLDSENSCVIPPEVLTGERFHISVTGVSENYKIKTNRVKVKQEVR